MTCRPLNVKPKMALLQVTSESCQNGLLLQEEEPVEVPPEAVEQEMDLLLEVHELLGLAPASQLASDLPSSWAAMEQTNLRWVGQLARQKTSIVLVKRQQHHKPVNLQLVPLFSTWLWQADADQAKGCHLGS